METTIRTDQTVPAQADRRLLRLMLTADCIVCAAAGIFLLVFAQPTATFLGEIMPLEIEIVGLILLASAALIFRTLRENPLRQASVRFVISGNVLWVVASIAVLILDLSNFTSGGRLAILIQAFITADVAFFELLGWRLGR